MNQELSNFPTKNGIAIPKEARLRCVVDPMTCYIKISDETGDGADRQELCKAVENALNVGEKGMDKSIDL